MNNYLSTTSRSINVLPGQFIRNEVFAIFSYYDREKGQPKEKSKSEEN